MTQIDNEDFHDESVLTNISYILSSFGAWGNPIALSVMLVFSTILAISSSLFHVRMTKWTQNFDIGATLIYLSCVAAIVVSSWTALGYLIIPFAIIYYIENLERIERIYHVVGWILGIMIMLPFQIGWWTIIPVLFVAVAGYLQRTTELNSWGHSFWHVLGAAAAFSVLYLI